MKSLSRASEGLPCAPRQPSLLPLPWAFSPLSAGSHSARRQVSFRAAWGAAQGSCKVPPAARKYLDLTSFPVGEPWTEQSLHCFFFHGFAALHSLWLLTDTTTRPHLLLFERASCFWIRLGPQLIRVSLHPK
ncbi:hypothetical protein ACKLNR_005811 [Fusarium oxysporum f. sp. zingiberi]